MASSSVLLISDPRVLSVPIVECGEPLVDVRELAGIRVDSRRCDDEGAYAHVRSQVAERLVAAQASLPDGVGLLFIEGYRPLERQRLYFDSYLAKLHERKPDLPAALLRQEAAQYVAPPDTVPPHSTGGAVDLTLVAPSGIECEMGSEVNASPLDTNGACFTASRQISIEARANRDSLISTMQAAGFVNYPTEWWHWSFGDRYWAYVRGEPAALYGPLEWVGGR